MNKFSILSASLIFTALAFIIPSTASAYPDMAGQVYSPNLQAQDLLLAGKGPILPPPTDDYSQMPGWPIQMGTGFFSPCEGPIQVDIDNDGNLEIFVGGGDGFLYGWHHNGTPVAGFPVQTSNPIQSSPSAGDIDGDGDPEILICNRNLSGSAGDVYAFHHNGQLVSGWPQHTNHGMGINSVGLWDFDNNGDLEVFVGSDRLYVWQGNGTLLPGFPANFSGSQYGTCSSSSVGDIDGDGQPEIILEGWEYLNAFNLDGTVCAGWPYALQGGQGFSYSAPSLVDIDNDGNVEIFCASHGSPNSWLYGLNGDGTSLPGFPQAIVGWTYSTPAIGDLDGDGAVEVALLCNSGILYAFETNGSPMAGWPVMMGQYNCEAALAMVDIDGNGQMDVLFGNNGGTGYYYNCYRANGTPHPDFPFAVGGAALPSCSAIADADGNGTLEIAYHVSSGTVYLWTTPYQNANAARPWPQPHHDIQHTGNYHFGAAVHDVSVTLVPYGTPIVIPPAGGSFSFNIAATNNETNPVSFQAWCMIMLPNGSPYGPVLGPVNLTLAGGASINRDRTQNVPNYAPAGNYTYRAYVGQYPSNIWDEDSFPFTKSATGDAGIGSGDWLNSGESFDAVSPVLTEGYHLLSNYPNPFNPTTAISFQLPADSYVQLRVYDTAGREVARLADGWREAGSHEVSFDGSHLPSGIYFARIEASGITQMAKMVLMK